MRSLCIAILLSAGLSSAAAAQGPASLILRASGSNGYVLQGQTMDGTAGLDLTLTYDPSVLSGLQVAPGPLLSGAMVAVNPNVPGKVRVTAVTLTSLTGSGVLLTLTFTGSADAQGIRGLSARLIDLQGSPLPSLVLLALENGEGGSGTSVPVASVPPASEDSAAPTGTSSGANAAGTGTAAYGSAMTAIGPLAGPPSRPDPPAQQEGSSRTAMAEPAGQEDERPRIPAPAEAAPLTDGPAESSRPVYTQPSVLERFQAFRGESSMQAYLGLFDQEPLIGFRQVPAIVLSDGIGTATVHFISVPERDRTTDLALIGAKLLSSGRDPESTNTLIVTLLPEPGSSNVRLAVMQEHAMMIDPITVAPRADIDLDGSGEVNKADFDLFLRECGPGRASRCDLNKDGVRDLSDAYIFTANYLVARQKAPARPSAP